jgi:hypothetical protein
MLVVVVVVVLIEVEEVDDRGVEGWKWNKLETEENSRCSESLA